MSNSQTLHKDNRNSGLYETLFLNGPDALCLIGYDGKLIRVNEAFRALFGNETPDLLRTSIQALLSPEEKEAMFTQLDALKSGSSQSLCLRVSHTRLNGELNWLDLTFSRMESENILLLIVRNVTELKFSIDAVNDANNMLTTISQALSEFISAKSNINPFNALLEQLLKLTHSEYGFIGEVQSDESGAPFMRTHALSDITWNEQTRALYEINNADGLVFRNLETLFGRVLKTGRPLISNSPLTDRHSGGLPKGHAPLRAFLGVPIYSGNDFIGMLGVANRPGGYSTAVIDKLAMFISACSNLIVAFRAERDRQKASNELLAAKKEAEQASKAKSEFLANMSHEVRTPLNGLIGMLELALEAAKDPQQKDFLDTAKDSTRTLLYLINDILDFSKIEAGKMSIDSVQFDIRESIDFSLQHFGLMAREKGLELSCHVDTSIPAQLVGDPMRLRQVLMNLVGNAIKFTVSGSVHVDIQRCDSADGHVVLEIAVLDTGIGIPQDAQDSIFEAFNQADTSITRRFGGTGLGLSISTALVRMMGGKMNLFSRVGVGSHFWFQIRFATVTAEVSPPVAVTDTVLEKPGNWRPLHVLLAEDNTVNQKLFRHMLTKRGHTVDVASNGRIAVDKLKRHAFDAILMDLQMPEMDGIEACGLIRKKEKAEGVTPHYIVALTAHALETDKERCLQVGMNNFISKPVESRELYKKLELVLEHSM